MSCPAAVLSRGRARWCRSGGRRELGADGRGPRPGDAYQDGFNKLATEDSTHSIPFYGQHQAGIATPPQTAAAFLSFEVTAGNRRELTDLFRTLTVRAAFLTKGGTPPPPRPGKPPEQRHLLGPTVLPDDLTVTVALGASLFDGRYGLAPRKPAQLKTMRAFSNDDLDPKITHGDLLVQVCANHRDTVGNAMLDIMRQTRGGMRLRWRMDAFRFPPRPVGIPRDWMGFKDGIANPDTTDASQMNQVVWVQPGRPEPAWTAGGTYQALRIIRMHLDKWDEVPVEQQERIFGRRKISGAPLYATDPNASDELDPIYTNDPQGRLTPLDCHIRRANPQTPDTAATSTILRRSFQYDQSPDEGGNPNIGHTFCCFQQAAEHLHRDADPARDREARPLHHPDRRRLLLRRSRRAQRTGLLRLGTVARAEEMIPARLRTTGGSSFALRRALSSGSCSRRSEVSACATSPSAEKTAAPARIYVTNQLDNTASVIDGGTHKSSRRCGSVSPRRRWRCLRTTSPSTSRTPAATPFRSSTPTTTPSRGRSRFLAEARP